MKLDRGLLALGAVAALAGLLFATLVLYLFRNQPPSIISISPPPNTRFVEHEIPFQAEAKDPEGEAVQYHWEFGDGSSSTEQNPKHHYAEGGDYNVKLIVSDPKNAKQTIQFRIRINQPPQAVAVVEPVSGSHPLTVRFDGSRSTDPDTGNPQRLKYHWDFGDGNTSNAANPIHSYERPGEYTVILTVEDADGARGQVKSSITVSIYANQPPIPKIQLSANQSFVGDEVALDGSRSRDHDGEIVLYEWDFDDDGRTDAQGPHITYRFSKPGQHSVKLTVTDNRQERRSTVSVIEIREPRLPIARFTFFPIEPRVGEDVRFDASNSAAPDSQIIQYEWDFNGDGESDQRGLKVSYLFLSPGKYSVTLTVIDNRAQRNRFGQEIHVRPKPVNQAPIARMTASNLTPIIGQSIVLDASDSYDPDGQIIRYEWDFDGDGKSDKATTDSRLTHTFSLLGRYDVSVAVFDNHGVSSSFKLIIQVTKPSVTPFLSASIAKLGSLSLYQGAIGLPLNREIAGELGFGYGEGQLWKAGYLVTLQMVSVDINILREMMPMIFLGGGIGLLVINGEYEIDWPVLGSRSFTQYVPVLNLKIGLKIGFLMLSVGVSYPVRE